MIPHGEASRARPMKPKAPNALTSRGLKSLQYDIKGWNRGSLAYRGGIRGPKPGWLASTQTFCRPSLAGTIPTRRAV